MSRPDHLGYAPVLRFPTNNRRVRASDAEREDAVAALREHHAAGRLDLAEFVARMEAAQDATYVDELPGLFHDLPTSAPRPRRSGAASGAASGQRPGRSARLRRVARVVLPILLVLAVLNLVPWWLVAVLVAVVTGLLLVAIPVAMVGGAAWLATSLRSGRGGWPHGPYGMHGMHQHRRGWQGHGWS